MVKNSVKSFVTGALVFYLLAMHVPAIAMQEISFSGEQDGYFEEGQYVATGNITVKRGKTLTFAPGSVVRFKPYTGIVVEGTLKSFGWESQPVVFTSDNNRPNASNQPNKVPAPFDWNGITVVDSAASVFFENVRISYSTYGLDIKSASSKVNLRSVVFSDNGRSGISVDDEQLGVIDNELFSFVQPKQDSEVVPVKSAPAAATPALVAPAPKAEAAPMKKISWRTPVRIAFGGITLAGAGFAAYEYLQAKKYNSSSQDKANPNMSGDVKKSDDAIVNTNIGWAILAGGACGLVLTFFF
jgi:hypothetical protein